MEYGERRMGLALAALADGQLGLQRCARLRRVRRLLCLLWLEGRGTGRIRVRVTKRADAITFDFTGTDRQRRGNVNAVEAVTLSAVAWALRSVTDPSIPANGGALRPLRLIVPPGTIVAAVPPVAVGAGNVEVSQRVADVCLGALAQAVPEPRARRRAGDDEQRHDRRRRVGVLRDGRRRPRWASSPTA